MKPEMKHDEAISEVLRLLGDNKKRQFPFLTEKEEAAVRALLDAYRAAIADLAQLSDKFHICETCKHDKGNGVNDCGRYDCDETNRYEWRGPCAENRRKEK